MTYTIFINTPGNYQHSETFRELAEGLQEGFAELGHVVKITTTPTQIRGRAIVFGAHIVPVLLPQDAIIFNTEQTNAPSGWFTEPYLHQLRTHEVWDYSQENIATLKTKGIEAKYCGIGYEPCLTRIQPQTEDIDVLFYGSIFGRRVPILEAVKNTGLKVKTLFGVYGAERDSWIARSKIVLNIHAYEGAPFEIVRVSYLWANQKFVISEHSKGYWNNGMLRLGSAEELPGLCLQYAQRPVARQEIAGHGFQQFTTVRQSEYLKRVL